MLLCDPAMLLPGPALLLRCLAKLLPAHAAACYCLRLLLPAPATAFACSRVYGQCPRSGPSLQKLCNNVANILQKLLQGPRSGTALRAHGRYCLLVLRLPLPSAFSCYCLLPPAVCHCLRVILPATACACFCLLLPAPHVCLIMLLNHVTRYAT